MYLKKTFTLWAVHTHTLEAGRNGLFIATYVRVERTFSCPYSCLRLTGNIRLLLTLSLLHSHLPDSLILISRSRSPPLRVCLTLLFLCVGEPCRERRPTGSLSRCRCAQRLLIVTSCAPASESCKVKKELVCVTERQLLKTQRGHQMFPS